MPKPTNSFTKIKMELTEKDWVTYKRFTWAKGKHAQLKQILSLILVFFVFPLFAFINIIDVSRDPSRNIWVGSYYILILFFYLLYKWFIGYPLNYRQNNELYEIKCTYDFFEDDFKVVKKSPRFNSETSIPYNDLYRIYETKTAFYFTLNKGLTLILRKDVLTDPLGLSQLFLKKIDKRYIDCR